MRRLASALLLLGLALALRFASFSVEPFGAQRFNLDTGVTVLPQGGVLTDNQNGLRLRTAYAEYKEGSFIRAREAELISGKEVFRAQTLEQDIPKQEARFTGLTFSNPDFQGLKADRALALFEPELVVLKGQVTAQKPKLSAETLVVDLKARQALILGPFTYQEGRATLKGQRPDSRLYLRFQGGQVQATTRIPQEALRLAPYADRL